MQKKLTNYDQVAMLAGGRKMKIFVEGCIMIAQGGVCLAY